MIRPDSSQILKPLKPFQRRTVDHAFDRLFRAEDGTARFLVADEVGLGKTLVARGVIARAIEHLWDGVGRIDIVYVCSNSNIARSNLQKLQVGGGAERSFATRLTMLATALAKGDGASLSASKLNFVSFTPGTSFNLRSSGGRVDERVVLFHLLKDRVGRNTGLTNLLQMGVGKDRWRWLVRQPTPLDSGVQKSFLESFSESGLSVELDGLIDDYFRRFRRTWPDDAQWRRRDLVGRLRALLAKACVRALEPDLVILDEFQRFRTLLQPSVADTAVELAQSLFNAITPEGEPVRTLLLSATPYKLYTADAEIEREDHYRDFMATTRFLFKEDETRVDGLQHDIARFGAALKAAAAGGSGEDLTAAKQRVQDRLRSVMARTERVAATVEGDSMVEDGTAMATPTAADVRQYLYADALFRAVGDRDPMPYWKSASYLAHFMHGYRFNQRLVEKIEESPEDVRDVVRCHSAALLRGQDLEAWQAIDPANAKLRDIVSDLLDGGLWQILWIPPTVPYWELEGPFAGLGKVTKTLLFSAWNVVPEVVSGILSYEAERRMVEGSRVRSYENPETQQGRLLRLNSAPRSRHRLFLLLLPCVPLADIHPLTALASEAGDPRPWVRTRIAELMEALPDPQDGQEDERWEWAAPLLLDPGLRDFLMEWREDEELPHPNPEHFRDYVDDLVALDGDELGRRPARLLDLLTDLALGSPAILAARSAAMSNVGMRTRRRVAVNVAEAFWHLFNRPAVISMLTRLDDSLGDGRYWRVVLRYCQQGNLAEAIRTMVADNIPASRHHGAAKHGDALLAGLVRCRRCGRKLTVRYSGLKHNIPRYSCHRGWMDNGEPRCIAFGGLRVDDAVEAALLEVVGPGAVEAAARAEAEAAARRDEVREALARDLEAARYAVDRAFRQYDAADPANRLVAAELEARWEAALDRQHEVEAKLSAHDGAGAGRPDPTPVPFATLAQDLRAVWKAPATDARLKKRIVRTLVHEVVADIDADAANGTGEVVLAVHWSGGVHTELRLPRKRRGQRNSTPLETVEAIRQLVLIANDDVIAGVLTRNGLRTGNGNRWTRERVCSLRTYRGIPNFRPAPDGIEPWLNLTNASALLKLTPRTLRLAAEASEIDSLHPMPEGPWLFKRTDLEGQPGRSLAARAESRRSHPAIPDPDQQSLFESTA